MNLLTSLLEVILSASIVLLAGILAIPLIIILSILDVLKFILKDLLYGK